MAEDTLVVKGQHFEQLLSWNGWCVLFLPNFRLTYLIFWLLQHFRTF